MIFVAEKEEKIGDLVIYLDGYLEKVLMLFDSIDLDEDVKEIVHNFDARPYIKRVINFEPLDRPSGPPPKSSVKVAPKLELIPQPAHLYYDYFITNEILNVVSSYFSNL